MIKPDGNRLWLYVLGGTGFTLFTLLVLGFLDEDLTQAAKADLTYRPPAVDPKQNAYYALIGLHAAKDLSPWQAGRDITLEYDKHVKQGGLLLEFDTDKYDWFGKLKVSNALAQSRGRNTNKIWCDYKNEKSCLAFYQSHAGLVADTISDNELLLSRYQDLYQYTHFQDETVQMFLTDLISLHRIFQARIGRLWLQNKKHAALDLLDKDIRFWKKVCASDTGLLHKMTSIAVLDKDIRLYSELLTEDHALVGQSQAATQLASSLATEQYGLKASFRREYQISAGYMIAGVGNVEYGLFSSGEATLVDKLFSLIFFRKNATVNSLHKIYLAQIELSMRAPDRYQSAATEYNKIISRYSDIYRLDMVYNPIGKILLTIAIPSFENYIVMFNNLELSRRLILLKQELLQKNIKGLAVNDYLLQSSTDLTNPYNLKAAQYDQQKAELYFDVPLEDHDRVSVKL